MILNETPVRTSNNFHINNYEIPEYIFPTIEKFLNRSIYINSEKEMLLVAESIEDSERLNDLYEDDKLLVTELTSDDFDLKYGISNEFKELSNKNANQPIKILSKENSNGSKVHINFGFDSNNKALVDNIEIFAEKNSKLDVIIEYMPQTINEDSSDKSIHDSMYDYIKYFHNGIIKVNVQENSSVNIIVINLLPYLAHNFISFENKVLDNANLNYTLVEFGGNFSISNYYSDLIGECSNNNLNTIYLGSGVQQFDFNYLAHCRGEKSNVNIEVQGALNNSSRKNFKGTIDFKKGCKKACGNENENCLLLSDKAKSIALPMLLCSEEDVEGNHSTSSGKAGQKELFYLMSRGLTEKEAMKLLVMAKFNKIIENIQDVDIRELVVKVIENTL